MMMMTDPEEPLFKNLLSDYAAPVEDDGFSASVLAAIEGKFNQAGRVKRRLLSGAVIMGGIIAALQVPALIRMTGDVSVPSLPSLTEMPYWAPVIFVVFGFMLWALLDNKGSEVI